jgi:hypothetical protein
LKQFNLLTRPFNPQLNPKALKPGKKISLFNLYFPYSTPIPLRHPLFPDFRVGLNYQVPGTWTIVGKQKYIGYV